MSSTHTASLAADFPAENSLTGLPNEILRKILELDFNLPKLSSKIILVSSNGEEHAHQLLTGERGRLAGVSKVSIRLSSVGPRPEGSRVAMTSCPICAFTAQC